jgi:CRISPR/Cas system CSM-associated protein Csm3 (group 7 of RAMP superfamily)
VTEPATAAGSELDPVTTFLIATVRLEPGWAVGSVELDDPAVDRDLLTDSSGQPWVPGSALAGSLRAHLLTHQHHVDQPDQVGQQDRGGQEDWVGQQDRIDERLMGSRPPENRAASERATVSRLWLLGAMFRADGDGPAETSTTGQTAVDPQRAAAVPKSLRISRVAESAGTLRVYLRCRGELSEQDLRLISSWSPQIGRDRTRGAGRATLVDLRYGTVDLATDEGMTTWLTHSGPGLVEAVATTPVPVTAHPPPVREFKFSIEDGLLVGGVKDPQVARTRKRSGTPLVPGSAWKGIIRSRFGFILRSRYGENAACRDTTRCPGCVACDIFGSPGQRGRLAFADSPITAAEVPEPRTQVGIDRVTGGARERLLFQTQPVTAGTLWLRIEELAPVQPWVWTVIDHVIRDIDDGLLGVGSRTTRGLGTLRLTTPLDPQPGPVTVPPLEPATDPAGTPARTVSA